MLQRVVVVLLAVLAAAQLAASSNDSAWRADIDYIVSELPRLHKDAFFHVSRTDFEAAAAALRSEIPSLGDGQVVARMTRLVAMIGDAHTTLSGYPFARYPIRMYWFEEGFHVTRATLAHADLLEARLLSIDGLPVEEAASRVAPFLSHENESWRKELTPSALVTADILAAAGVAESPAKARFMFVARDGALLERELGALDASATEQWSDSPDGINVPLALPYRNASHYYWYEYLPAERTLYVKYNVCRDDPGRPFLSFGEELGAVVAEKAVDRIVLDMRHNGGGNSAVLQPLITGVQTLPGINQRERFFVIIGRRTFSSAMLNAMQLDDQTNATFLGEPTGGKPNSYGEVLSVNLPNSQLRLQYSTRFFQMAPGEDPPSFAPDVILEPSADDYFAGRDRVLQWIYRSTRRRSVSR
jgi:hypothetical protein